MGGPYPVLTCGIVFYGVEERRERTLCLSVCTFSFLNWS